jgi:hypothetical protein
MRAKSRRFAIPHANITASTSGLTSLLIVVSILHGCADIEQNTESHRSEPDAWEKRLERIQRGEEQVEVTTTNENLQDLDERYRTAQRDLEERFQACFQGVFRNKTFDAGVPWKSEGQGTRRIIAVTTENEVQHWNINKSVRQCEKYFSEPFKGVEEKKLVVRVRKLPYTYKFEEGGNLLCKYQEDDMWQGGVTKYCNTRMPVFMPG